MKKTLLTIGLALATMPLTFAAQSQASTPAGQSNSGKTATATTPTKKVKKVKKTAKPAPASNSTAKPADTSAPAAQK